MEVSCDDKAAPTSTINDRQCTSDPASAGVEDTSPHEPHDVWIKIEKCEREPSPQPTPVTAPLLVHTIVPVTVKCEFESSPCPAPAHVSAHSCECGRQFRSAATLAQHRLTHTQRPTFDCQLCHRSFQHKANLTRHQSHGACLTPPPILPCPECGKQFRQEFLLKSHLRRHSTEKPYSCHICNMRFKHKSTVQRHLLLHSDSKPHACDVCGKRFTTANLIIPHMRTHTKEKPYQCPICLKKFSLKHNMQRHTLNHNKVKHLSCSVCNKQFPRESRLKYHMRVHWDDNRPFKCRICPKSYSHKQNIQRHYAKKHPNIEFLYSETDAELANKAWEASNAVEPDTEYIIPEDMSGAVKEEPVVMKPELVILKEGSSSEESSDEE